MKKFVLGVVSPVFFLVIRAGPIVQAVARYEAKTVGRKSTALDLLDAEMLAGTPSVQEAELGTRYKNIACQ